MLAGVATSDTATTPWAEITQTAAITACSNAGGHLMTNDEWMTIARNVEAQTANWADGVIGSTVASGGGLFRGNTGETSGSVGYNGANPEFGTSRDAKAELVLSNGETIWDISGNVWEWTNDTLDCSVHPVAGSPASNWYEFTQITDYKGLDDGGDTANTIYTEPSNSAWNSSQGMGKIYTDVGDTGSRAFLRGGSWGNGASAGVFALSLHYAPASSSPALGFRCVR